MFRQIECWTQNGHITKNGVLLCPNHPNVSSGKSSNVGQIKDKIKKHF